MKKLLKTNAILLTGLLLSITSAPSVLAESKTLTLTTEQQKVMGLKTSVLKQVDAYPSANFSARAMIPLDKRHQLSAAVSGKVVALYHPYGAINKGGLVAEIESPEFIQMQQRLIMVVTYLEIAKQNLKRAEALSKSGTASVKNLNSARAEVVKFEVEKQQRVSQLKMAGLSKSALSDLLKTQEIKDDVFKVISQVNGQVDDLQVMLNQVVEKGQTIVTLGETDPMIFEAYVPQAFASQLQEGQEVNFPYLNKRGVIEHVHAQVDEMTQAVNVQISVDNPEGDILKGQLGQAQFLFKAPPNTPVYEVPTNALSQLRSDKVVFFETENGIQAVQVDILSITNGQLFFSPKKPPTNALKSVYSQGSTAIKSAFAATEEE